MTYLFKKDDIVRRRNGRTPMVITRPGRNAHYNVHASYCGHMDRLHDEGDIFHSDKLVLITSTSEIAACRDWRDRLTPAQYARLMAQIDQHNNLADHDGSETKGPETMTKLYQTKEETPRYGTKLTVNSIGKVVLEMKGTGGAVETFDPDQLELVVPYTVKMQNLREQGKTFHATAVKGQVDVGDVIIGSTRDSGVVWLVVLELDTQQQDNIGPLTGRKVLTAALDG